MRLTIQEVAVRAVDAPLDRIPVFLRDDADLPIRGDAG